nr:MAG TPA: hypothetical protein [Caudoviricetes sp.]
MLLCYLVYARLTYAYVEEEKYEKAPQSLITFKAP